LPSKAVIALTLGKAGHEAAKKLTIPTVCAVAVMGLQVILFGADSERVLAQNLPAPEDTRHSMLREAMLGLLTGQPSITENAVRQHCLALPVDAPNDRLQSPHGDFLISTNCEVVPEQPLDRLLPAGWITSRYRWTSVFTAEDTARGPDAQTSLAHAL
jgi:hypothetical protein